MQYSQFHFQGYGFCTPHDITYAEGPYQVCVLSWIELGLGYAWTFILPLDSTSPPAAKSGNTGELIAGRAIRMGMATGIS